ncbi:hypothetical protein AcW2_000477 [Taiwanofungus camphoratus]|nr:hypothetical protein AcW2_000477 [Antrodia cinnamomea]
MAMSQAYVQANKGTLLPGQTISVNKYTVQVERYLSQGGFAHVYLVTTPTPVYNTTHHVLKRIAVPNEAMLTEVKKEVDIMRILKGHPNIVHLIDAAWHRLLNGTYEVFILMEFCAGGGIIDMMNRRLRERLTEPEILTIFVDVCEGVAAMHALKPPLLHRDLKVENILQASLTSYKLCDFGSATPVQKVPTNAQEMRTLEADLNRHTTLQYRAPEMVDVYLRRPVDEKSDVWALGVLLYKLCYYTTPFEEHGPLAILNVQYKIPPYPVYSNQLNALIASMLREHGAQRPTVFEVLAHVHKLRGTKSRFTHNVSPKEPLSPRFVHAPPLQTLSPNVLSPPPPQRNPLDDLVSFKAPQSLSTLPAKTSGIEARDKVLEAIAPMRRGRPTPSTTPAAPSPPVSPKKTTTFELDMKFGVDDDRAWRGVRGHKSGLASTGRGVVDFNKSGADAWGLSSRAEWTMPEKDRDRSFEKAFENDFAGFGKSFGNGFEPAKSPMPLTTQFPSSPMPQAQPTASPKLPSTSHHLHRHQSVRAAQDAFDGLGLSAPPPPPTLGEARKSRTGLASLGMSSGLGSSSTVTQYLNAGTGSLGTSNTTYRPPSSHAPMRSPSPRPQPSPSSQALSPVPLPGNSWGRHMKVASQGLSAEERFPSLEDLDRTFGSPSPGALGGREAPTAHASTQPSSTERLGTGTERPPSRARLIGNLSSSGSNGISTMSSTNSANRMGAGKSMYHGIRSQQVTGTAMRESRMGLSRQPSIYARPTPEAPSKEKEKDVTAVLRSRPSAARRHRSSTSMRTHSRAGSTDILSPGAATAAEMEPTLPPRPSTGQRDWLTGGDDDGSSTPENIPIPQSQPQPVIRDSPSKRASFVERSPIAQQKALEVESVAEVYQAPVTSELRRPTRGETQRTWEKDREKEKEERPSRSPGRTKAFVTRTGAGAGSAGTSNHLHLPQVDTRAARTGTTPSPSGLTENWSPIAPTSRSSRSSSSDDGPEDLNGYVPRSGEPGKMKELGRVKADGEGKTGEKRRRTGKGRQSSVHDLVDLWGGGVSLAGTERDKEQANPDFIGRQTEKRRSVIMPSPSTKLQQSSKPRAESPQPLIDTSIAPIRVLPTRPPSSQHRRQPSTTPASRQAPAPSPAPGPMSARSRPQSLFVTSLSKSSSTENSASLSTVAAPVGKQTLSLPEESLQSRRSFRRSSISDMVQHYESISGSTKGQGASSTAPAPVVASRSSNLTLEVKLSGRTGDSCDPSPSFAATRFPKLSPTSPILPKASLTVPNESGSEQDFAKNRASPTGLPSRSSPNGQLKTPYGKTSDRSNMINGLPSRWSPLQLTRSLGQEPTAMSQEAPSSPFPMRKAATPPEETVSPDLRSPSPERPYQGVSKLIDRWQRAVEDSGMAPPGGGMKRGGLPSRRAGVVGGESGRGR